MSDIATRIIELLKRQGPTPLRDIVTALGVERSPTNYALRTLAGEKRLERHGQTNASRWRIPGDKRSGPEASPANQFASRREAKAGAPKPAAPVDLTDAVTIGPPPAIAEASRGEDLVVALLRERTRLVGATAGRVAKIDALLAAYAS